MIYLIFCPEHRQHICPLFPSFLALKEMLRSKKRKNNRQAMMSRTKMTRQSSMMLIDSRYIHSHVVCIEYRNVRLRSNKNALIQTRRTPIATLSQRPSQPRRHHLAMPSTDEAVCSVSASTSLMSPTAVTAAASPSLSRYLMAPNGC